MKKTIFTAIVALVICLTSCEDELIATSDTRSSNPSTTNIELVVDTVPNVVADTIWVDVPERYPIGFSVTVNDYKEVE